MLAGIADIVAGLGREGATSPWGSLLGHAAWRGPRAAALVAAHCW